MGAAGVVVLGLSGRLRGDFLPGLDETWDIHRVGSTDDDLTVEMEADAHFRQQIAGHVEMGRDSVTAPAIGKTGD